MDTREHKYPKAQPPLNLNAIREGLVSQDEIDGMMSWFPGGGVGDRDGIAVQAIEHVVDLKRDVLALLDAICENKCVHIKNFQPGDLEMNLCGGECVGIHGPGPTSCTCETHAKEFGYA